MDQDFHYYGTYYAARVGGQLSPDDATLVGRASNFIDFLHEGGYGGYWRIVRDREKRSAGSYRVVGDVISPRYTFQAGKLGTGMSPEDGLWCSYHFTPGNFEPPDGTPTPTQVHGRAVAEQLPPFVVREIRREVSREVGQLLNRPQSAISRALILDTIKCATDSKRLEEILVRATGGWDLLRGELRDQTLQRFRLILLGVRAHVIADTWAHQDWSGISNETNTYWDVNNPSGWGRQSIDYQDVGSSWKNVVLSATSHENLQAVPNGTSYLGHGWMGHLPDYGFIKYRYRPCWRDKSSDPLVRDNPTEYHYAFLELCSLFSLAQGRPFDPAGSAAALEMADAIIASPCEIADKQVCPRQHSSTQWVLEMSKLGMAAPSVIIDAKQEPDPRAVMPGIIDKTAGTSVSRYGTYYVTATSDLYLFDIAADYHFYFVKSWLSKHNIMDFTGTWSTQIGPLSPLVTDLF